MKNFSIKECSVMVSTGNLGDNIIEKVSFEEGLKRKPSCLAADAGTADAGPTFLGGDIPHNPVEWEYHDLELMLLASRELKVPMIIGSCSTTGTNRAVNLYAKLVRNIAKKHKLEPFKMALIFSEINNEYIASRLAEGIEPLGASQYLTLEDVEKTDHITASMGVEQLIFALKNGAEVVLAGRCCDDAVIAAYPIFNGFPKGLSLHMGKAIECASLVCTPQMVKETVIGTVSEHSFTIEPMHPNQRATPHSVAAHSMYERVDPYIQGVPGGTLDMHHSNYTAATDRICKVTGSVFIPSKDGSYKVKLEGAGKVGHRVFHFVAIRDPFALQHMDKILIDVREKVSEIFSPKKEGSDYFLFFHVYGKNGVMGDLETIKEIKGHEVAILIEAIANTEEIATSVVKCAKFRFFYLQYSGQKNSSGGSAALVIDEPLYPKSYAYQWTIDHLLKLKDPMEVFKAKFEIV